ncbi:MAG TPA: nicotinate-nucleotide adenylyltransferase [Stellaceae bacterium]|nr:nicotinate-nucleotide adenylyltransferase [Stellaceae bacterium]
MAPRRVGLLGGSFNPAHQGHLHVSLEALARLDLDEVWWLVSPQNPLKAKRGMASFARRTAGAQKLASGHKRIRVLDLEARLGTRFTVDTLAALRRRWPKIRFVWLMGADILAELPRWKRWPELFGRVPVAVFARPIYCAKSLAGKASLRFSRYRAGPRSGRRLASLRPPAWTFLRVRLDPSSGTALRAPRPRKRLSIDAKR